MVLRGDLIYLELPEGVDEDLGEIFEHDTIIGQVLFRFPLKLLAYQFPEVFAFLFIIINDPLDERTSEET